MTYTIAFAATLPYSL